LKETVKQKLYNVISEALSEAVKDGKLPEGDYPDVKVEYPRDAKFGDYSTPIALESAKVVKRSPIQTGDILKEYIEKSDFVGEVEVVKPGFINIYISHAFLSGLVGDVLEQREKFGTSVKENPVKYNLEFVSANPTGPMNVVSARAAALGDSIANLITANGDRVEREFYVNDYGNQVNLLGRSVHARILEQRGRPFDFPEDGYQGEYIRDIATWIIENESEVVEQEDNDEKIAELARLAVEYNVSGQKKDLGDFNVEFQRWFREKGLHENGDVMGVLSKLEETGYIYEEDGKKVFRSTEFGDDKDRVVVRDDGRPTYLLADIAYHYDKVKRGYDKLINIWGPDHHGYIARLKGAVHALTKLDDKLEILIAQQVNLIEDGEAVKMSKRLGKFSTMRDLIDEVGVDAARYFFVMRSMDSHLDFDIELAKRHSSENPVFYLQYAHARICSIFKEAYKRDFKYEAGKFDNSFFDNDECRNILKMIMKYSEEVSDAAEHFEPHKISTFLMRLAQLFHRFYTEHRILTEDQSKSNSYLCLADSVRTVLNNGLTMLGVSAPESM